jgi:hypothetical protein
VRSEKSIRVAGQVVIETMGKQTPLEFVGENSMRVRVFSKE